MIKQSLGLFQAWTFSGSTHVNPSPDSPFIPKEAECHQRTRKTLSLRRVGNALALPDFHGPQVGEPCNIQEVMARHCHWRLNNSNCPLHPQPTGEGRWKRLFSW